ncbi:MAG TPA: tyrosine--tRNA ligase [Gemmatimonadaceae bacterium]|nr:tyrosine--tRNA ligase [Gemmatimonadaceae bacterium]
MSHSHPLLDELAWRGLLHQHTDGLSDHLSRGQVTAYCGFDPTAPSLHVGNLVPVMGLVHLQRAGHRPVALVGGFTGMIGDPSGKSAERALQSLDVIEDNARRIGAQLERFFAFDGPAAGRMANNVDWLGPLSLLEFLRTTGKHFTVNYMLAKDSVKSRLEGGISYTEFTYMLLQAHDYAELYRRHGVTLQVGGSDQWGNMTAGLELLRRTEGAEAHVLTFPLVTTASGQKFGKSEAGAVYLDPARTSPYRFYQFWLGADDRDVGRWLRYFTFLSREAIEALDAATDERPEAREAQRALAADMTTRVHGEDVLRTVESISQVLFGKGDPRALTAATLEAMAAEVPFAEVDAPADGAGVDALDLVVSTGLAKSRGDAKRLVEQGGVAVNGRKVSMADRAVPSSEWLDGRHLLVKKGSRDWGLVRVR